MALESCLNSARDRSVIIRMEGPDSSRTVSYLHFQVMFDPCKGLLFQHKHDRKIIHVDPSAPSPGPNTFRERIFTDLFDHVILYDHYVRRQGWRPPHLGLDLRMPAPQKKRVGLSSFANLFFLRVNIQQLSLLIHSNLISVRLSYANTITPTLFEFITGNKHCRIYFFLF